VNVETYPSHITALPVGVNIQCHSARFKSAEL
jgi:fumarate hydratase subunit alpha